MSAEELAQKAADQVREVIADAERRAEEIVREAEAEAERIRESAKAETPPPPDPTPDPMPSPGPPTPDPSPPDPTPDPGPPGPPAPGPQISAQNGAVNDDAAAKLVAMQLALSGKGREQIASELESRFGAGDRAALLDDVLARAGN
jgi:cell division septum initiation protein DivIVA